MPKIIPELRERFVAAARRQMLDGEDHDFTIRQVARDCRTAVGTVYNYFPSKEALITAVMLKDWQACCAEMEADARAKQTALAALEATTAALRRFTARYGPTWRQYAAARGSVMELSLRHRQIIETISGPVGQTLDRFGACFDRNLPEVLSELVLLASRTEDGFRRIEPVLARILDPRALIMPEYRKENPL